MSRSDQMYNFSNPKRVGPGAWMMFMIMSGNCDDTESARLVVCKQIRLFVDYFGCGDCTPHARAKLAEDPPENYISTNRELFSWVVRFMNEVNVRLGKSTYEENILWKRFTETDYEPCNSGCDGTHRKPERTTKRTDKRGSPFKLIMYGI